MHSTSSVFNGRHVTRARLIEFVQEVVRPAGSLPAAFAAAHTLTGVMGGLLTHAQLGEHYSFDELYHLGRFLRTKEYDQWLASDTGELDALARRPLSDIRLEAQQ